MTYDEAVNQFLTWTGQSKAQAEAFLDRIGFRALQERIKELQAAVDESAELVARCIRGDDPNTVKGAMRLANVMRDQRDAARALADQLAAHVQCVHSPVPDDTDDCYPRCVVLATWEARDWR